MIRQGHLTDEALSAHADHALVEDELHVVREHLASCALCQRRAQGVRALAERVRVLPAERGASSALRAGIEGMFERDRRRRRARKWIALGASLAACAAALSVWLVKPSPPLAPALRDELALDHRHYMPIPQPAQFPSSDPSDLAEQLSRALARPVKVPSWEASALLGGRTCQIDRNLVPLILYERAGHRVSLFELPAEKAIAGCDRAEGFNVCARARARGGAVAVVSDLPKDDLERLLKLSLEQID